MKHYKSAEFLSIFRILSPLHKRKSHPQKRKAPLLKTFWRRFWSSSGPHNIITSEVATNPLVFQNCN